MSHESPSGPMPPGQPSALGLDQVGRADEVRPPRPDEALSANASPDDRRLSVEFLTLAIIATLTLAWVGGTHLVTNGLPSFGNGAVKAIVERIIARLVEQNAAMLKKRGLPVTPGTLYLTHFAGPAGALAVLSVSENADAASHMASADATGRTTREKLVNANPFLKELTVGDLKNWANRKMRSY